MLTAGTRIGPYTIAALIGEGGMGQVYRARDGKLHRDVALKILPPAFARDDERLARFAREAQTLAALNHPGVAAIYGVEDSADVRALVMEFVDGEDLSKVIARGPVAVDDVVAMARQIAEALEAAHELGVVHRDLKPANIKVRPDGAVKVLDFGLAKALDPLARAESGSATLANSPTVTSPAMTQQGVILGTAAYMAPEQARGRAVDKRADIWAFGVVVYEMLTGARLFSGDTVTDTLAAVLTHAPDFSRLPAGTSPTLVTLLRRCLERDPKRRLRDIGEARLLLSETASPETLPSSQPTSTSPLGGWKRWTIAVAWTLVAMVSGVGIARFLGGADANPTAPGTAAASSLRSVPLTFSGNVISASISPDGRYLAFVESEQGRQSLWLQQNATGQTLRLVPERAAAYWGHTFTPDGNAIVFGLKGPEDVGGSFYSISTLGGVPRRLVRDIDSPPTFSPDGRRMAFVRIGPGPTETALVVADADGANSRALATATAPESFARIFYGGPAWSPDGKTIVTAMARRAAPGAESRSRLVQVSVAAGGVSSLADPGWLEAAHAAWRPDGRSLLVVARSGDQITPQIWSVSYPGGQVHEVTNDPDDYRIVSLTQDGRSLVTVTSQVSSRISILPLKTSGAPVRIGRSNQDGIAGVSLDGNGRVVYVTGSTLRYVTPGVADMSGLWAARLDGSDRTPLVRGGEGLVSSPTVFADGSMVYQFLTGAGADVRVAEADGTMIRTIVKNVRVADVVSASRDGRVIAYTRLIDGAPRVFRIDRDGKGEVAVTAGISMLPAVDPDGQRVAYYFIDAEGRFHVGVSTLDGRRIAQFQAVPPAFNSRLALTAEGVVLNTVLNDRANVWLQPLDGKPARRLTSFDDQLVFNFAVAPDGSALAVARGPRLRDARLITGFDGGTKAAR